MLTTLQFICQGFSDVEWRIHHQWYSFGCIRAPVGTITFHRFNGWFCLRLLVR